MHMRDATFGRELPLPRCFPGRQRVGNAVASRQRGRVIDRLPLAHLSSGGIVAWRPLSSRRSHPSSIRSFHGRGPRPVRSLARLARNHVAALVHLASAVRVVPHTHRTPPFFSTPSRIIHPSWGPHLTLQKWEPAAPPTCARTTGPARGRRCRRIALAFADCSCRVIRGMGQRPAAKFPRNLSDSRAEASKGKGKGPGRRRHFILDSAAD